MNAAELLVVGFVRGKGISSDAIGWFGGGYWSHVTTLLPGGTHVLDARSDIVQGIPEGVQIRPVDYLKDDECVWMGLPGTAAQVQKALDALHSQIGKPYDVQGIIDFADNERLDPNWQNESAWFCDELAAWSWIRGGWWNVDARLKLYPNRLTPGGAAFVIMALHATVLSVGLPPAYQ